MRGETRRGLPSAATVEERDIAGRLHDLRGAVHALAFAVEGAFATEPARAARVQRLVDRVAGMSHGLLERAVEACAGDLVELDALVGEVVDDHADEAAALGVLPRVRSTARPLVRGRPDDLRRAVANVVRNALEFSPPAGLVDVSVALDGEGRASVVVRDEGPGVPPPLRRRVFAPGVTTRQGGTGLGLAVVHRIVRQHGGVVRFLDEPHGAVELRLPTVEH